MAQAGDMRPSKRRGDSFNVGKFNSVSGDRKQSSPLRHPPHSSDPPWPGPETRWSTENQETHHGKSRNAGPRQHHRPDIAGDMNRRRSEGPGSLSSSVRQSGSSRQPQNLQHPPLLSMKSSPNLSKSDDKGGIEERESATSPRDKIQLTSTRSSPNIPDEITKPQWQRNGNISRSVYKNSVEGERYVNANMYKSDMSFNKRGSPRRSMPAHNLQRYQPDYENVSHLGTAPLQSEKISEIDDIDEVTGRNSIPPSPDPKFFDPLGSHVVPARDPASLKYIKVNQNHEKYPSWPVTKANGNPEATQSINTRAQSMTDNTNTNKEFPNKQKLAYTPGLRPLNEKTSPVSERKEDGKPRNTSDPGFKSEFVYDRFGRVQKKNYANIDNKFEDFYLNSKPGYPPPNMDSDGHKIEDKDYNVPSPPERDSSGVDQSKLSSALGNVLEQNSRHQDNRHVPARTGPDVHDKNRSRPTNLDLLSESGPGSRLVNSSTSPLESGTQIIPDGHLVDSQNNPPYQTRQSPTHQQNNQPNQQSSGLFRSRPKSQHDQRDVLSPQRDRPGSFPKREGAQTGLTKDRPSPISGQGDRGKAYIVKSTPYYNTSTQTDNMMPYAVKVSGPLSAASSRHRSVETQVKELATQTSPTSPREPERYFGDKSVQARMSADFQNSEDRLLSEELRQDHFRYPAYSGYNPMQSSPFEGIESIQAKYAFGDGCESPINKDEPRDIIPTFSDNSASILRKLSEEFYGNRNGAMQEKRMSSNSSEQSPRFDSIGSGSGASGVFQQPGMREAESYSSVVIHHNESSGLFGRDDYSSSASDSRHDLSSVFSDNSSIYKNVDIGPPRGRRSLDPTLGSNMARFQNDIRNSGQIMHHRESSAPVSARAVPTTTHMSPTAAASGKTSEFSAVSGASSDQSIPSQPSSSPTNQSSCNSVSFGSNSQSSIHLHSSTVSSTQATQDIIVADDQSAHDYENSELNKDDDVFDDFEFSRKPSMRKAYGIYDETERLISQSKVAGKLKGASQSNKYVAPSSSLPSSEISDAHQNYPHVKRLNSSALGQIQEETDPNSVTSQNPPSSRGSGPPNGGRYGEGNISSRQQKYAWQNEDWLRRSVELPKGTNLKRTTSEQIAMPRHYPEMQHASYDAESAIYANPNIINTQGSRASYPAYENREFGEAPMTSSTSHMDLQVQSRFSRTQSAGTISPSCTEGELKKLQQQALLSFYQRKTSSSSSSISPSLSPGITSAGPLKYTHSSSVPSYSADSSMYETIGDQRSPTESVADIISKAHENLAKSAQRVDSIRRSNSISSRTSSQEYVEMRQHDRMRRETDWSRLRSSGSLRYSPDPDRRSNRNSYASENHYEDISLFAPTTPRGSVSESREQNLDHAYTEASMDGSLVAQNYQNFPSKRRPPPPVPRSPSPEAPPPELPPRKYREALPATSTPSRQSKSPINVIPLGKQLKQHQLGLAQPQEDSIDASQIDNSKRDFRSLMTQWENSSPREDKYAAELRKQAQRLTTQQQHQQQTQQQQQQHHQMQHQPQQQQQIQYHHQQQLNAIPMSLMHSRTKINVATTYKREPMLPQEATSPISASSSSSSTAALSLFSSSLPSTVSRSSPNLISTSNSAGASLSSVFSSSSALSTSPSSSVSSQYRPHNSPKTSPKSNTSPSMNTPVCGTSPVTISNNNKITTAQSKVTSLISQVSQGIVSSSVTSVTPRTLSAEDTRARSNSDVAIGQPVPVPGTNSYIGGVQTNNLSTRNRSASDNDILSDHPTRIQHSPSSAVETQPGSSPNAASRWRPKRGPGISPTSSDSGRGYAESHRDDQDLPPPPPELLQGSRDNSFEEMNSSTETDGFSDETYIGQKYKSSRAIGTYKRSKSAAVLQTTDNAAGGEPSSVTASGSINGIDDVANAAFPEKKLGTWSSESALMLSSHKQQRDLLTEGFGIIPELSGGQGGAEGDNPPPARPARPSLAMRQPCIPSSTITSSFQVPSSSVSPNSKQDLEQTTLGSYRESPRRQPPPVPSSPPYDTSQAPAKNHNRPGEPSAVLSWSPTGENQSGLQQKDNLPFSQYSQKRRDTPSQHNNTNDLFRKPSVPNSARISPTQTISSNSTLSSSPQTLSSSQDPRLSSIQSASSSSQHKIHTDSPQNLPPNDFHRRESAPIRPQPMQHHLSDPLDASRFELTPLELSRRKSEGSMVLSPRSDHSGSSHSRQPSQEELECDQKAKELATELGDNEQKLSEVLRLDSNKKRMQYMDGLFSDGSYLPTPRNERSMSTSSAMINDTLLSNQQRNGSDTSLDISDSSKRGSLPKEYWVSPPKALLEIELRKNEEVGRELTRDINDSDALMKQKEELLGKLHKKLDILKEAKLVLQDEITENSTLGMQVCRLVESKCQSRSERDKFNTYIDDMEKIVRLLLNLSGQLARAENAVQGLAPNVDSRIKKMTMDKRDRLHSKHEEAKLLKDDIDKRSDQLSTMLRDRLDEGEFADYTHYIKMKSKLMIELQELEDKITLGGEQILELKKSIPDNSTAHR